MQDRHSNTPFTISNRPPRVDINPQFLQTCIFGVVSVMLLDEHGDSSITAEELAGRWETINYEVTSGIAQRYPSIC
jgi:alanine racemase